MVKRLLSSFASDFAQMSANELKASIVASEGRTILSENIVTGALAGDITNSEIARAFGADLILLNVLDVFDPKIAGMPDTDQPIRTLKEYVGRPVGVNLEPVDPSADMVEDILEIPEGRKSTVSTLKKANELGFDFICLTGNPGTGVTNKAIAASVREAEHHFEGLVIAGKMHGAGVNEPIVNLEAIESFIEEGADIILLPSPGTVPGVTLDEVNEAVKLIKQKGALSMSAIGTSQESSDPAVIRQIALMNKMAGVDIHHIGDGSFMGIAPYLNILEYSRTIRGDRHTVHMIAGSNAR